jgi:hypothetical protein
MDDAGKTPAGHVLVYRSGTCMARRGERGLIGGTRRLANHVRNQSEWERGGVERGTNS